ncbi:MAG: hypothetical protein QG608_192 [Actinomycetota bacterium]|nr:hypothetical protein [Actinomycetota bacterium]
MLTARSHLVTAAAVAVLLMPGSAALAGLSPAAARRIPTRIDFDQPMESTVHGGSVRARACVHADRGTPAGNVILRVDGERWGEAVLQPDGCVNFSVSPALDIGEHTVQAAYTGSFSHAPAWRAHALVVEKADVGLESHRAPDSAAVPAGEQLSWAITVYVDHGPYRPTGSVNVSENGEILGSAELVNSKATVTLPQGRTAGLHSFAVSYSGDRWFTPRTVHETLRVFDDRTPSVLLSTADPTAASSGGWIRARTEVIRPVPEQDRVELFDTRTGRVLGHGRGPGPHTWKLTRVEASYDLAVRGLNAQDEQLYRTAELAVSWTRPEARLSASTTQPPAGSPAVLDVGTIARPGPSAYLGYVRRVVEVDTGDVLAECHSSEEPCTVGLTRAAGSGEFVARLVAETTNTTIAQSAPLRITWR